MASINYAAREISVKIVYYGPGLSGKTTNLQIIHRKVPPEYRSDMVSLATETDRTLFFDFLPLDLGKIKGFSTKFQLYTVPGQVYYNATRKLVLRGVDGVVFVADSGSDKIQENLESFQNLEENLAEYGYKRETIPIILQYNKRDLPNALPIDEINRQINKYDLPWSEAVANKGVGVFDSLKLIGKIVIDYLNKKYSRPGRSGGSSGSDQMASPIRAQQPVQKPQPQSPNRQQAHHPCPPQQAPTHQNFPPRQVPPNPAQKPQVQQPFQQQYPGPQNPMDFQSQPPVRQPQRSQPMAPPPPQMMATPSQLQVRQAPIQPPSRYQHQPAGFTNPAPPVQQSGGMRPSTPTPPMYQHPHQGGVHDQGYQQHPSIPNSNRGFRQNSVQHQGEDSFSDEVTFEPQDQASSFQSNQNAAYSNDEYFNYGNVNLNSNNTPQFEQPQMNYQQPMQQGAVPPSAPNNQSQKTDLDLEIEKYQREIEEKQRIMRAQGQIPPMQMSPPAPQPIQQPQRPPMPGSHQQNHPKSSEQDYDVYDIELSGYQAGNQPPTQLQPAVPASESDDDMYFTSIDTDRQKKPIRKPVNPRTQQQKGFLSKFFNGNNREMP